MATLDWKQAARLNELRQCKITRDLAEEATELGDGVMTYSKGVPWISRVTGLGLSAFGEDPGMAGPDAAATARYERQLKRAIGFYRERGAQAKVETCSLAPESLLAALGRCGFRTVHYENVLAADLASPTPEPEHGPVPGLEIVRIDPADEAAIRAAALLATKLFLPPDQEPPETMLEAAAKALRYPHSIGLLALLGGEPVGACGMEMHEVEGVLLAALWGAAVEPRARRRGVQLALLRHRLALSRGRGCVIALIESKPGVATERNAARVGFQLAYVRSVFETPPPEDAPPQ